MPITVRYDGNIFAVQRRGGISNYFLQLHKAFTAHPSLGVVSAPSLTFAASNYPDSDWPIVRLPAFMDRKVVRIGLNSITSRVAETTHRGRQREVLHSTFYDRRLRSSPGKRLASAVTVHDMIPELYPALFPEGNPHPRKREQVARADLVLCVSETTRQDLLDIYGPLDANVVVTPLAASHHFYRRVTNRPPSRYILFVGQRAGYKNFRTFLETCALLKDDYFSAVVVGPPLQQAEMIEIDRLGLSRAIQVMQPSDSELARLYRNATAFIFPSRYEGFGLPTLEAMASGCPCVLADIPAFHEVGGAAAKFVAPDDSAGFAEVVRSLEAGSVRERLTTLGFERALEYNWRSTAEATAKAYASV